MTSSSMVAVTTTPTENAPRSGNSNKKTSNTMRRGPRDSTGSAEHNVHLEEGMDYFDSFAKVTPKAAEGFGNRNGQGHFSDDSLDSVGKEELILNDAVNGALVGENVFDSPSGHTKKVFSPSASGSGAPPVDASEGRQPPAPHPPLEEQQQHHETSVLSDTVAISVGLVSQGLSWIRRGGGSGSSSDERKRRSLQEQAEEQARKIREAQQQNGSFSLSERSSASLADNATFQTLAKSSSTDNETSAGGINQRVRNNMEHSNRLRHNSSDSHASSHSANNGTAVAAASQQLPDDGIIHKKGVSRSGDGFMVEFAVPDEHEEDLDWVPPVRIQAEENLSSAPFILTPPQRQLIAQRVLPTGIAYAKWKRLYSLARDGDSFEACLRLLEGHVQTLLVVRTSTNEVLGGFADMAWEHHQIGGTSYHGGPTSCLYSFAKGHPLNGSRNATSNSSDSTDDNNNNIRVYKWTGANRYIQLCDTQHKMFAFGGGGADGEFGLAVAQDFQHGSSGPCDTFDNEPLCSTGTNFFIVDLEIYCFLLGQF